MLTPQYLLLFVCFQVWYSFFPPFSDLRQRVQAYSSARGGLGRVAKQFLLGQRSRQLPPPPRFQLPLPPERTLPAPVHKEPSNFRPPPSRQRAGISRKSCASRELRDKSPSAPRKEFRIPSSSFAARLRVGGGAAAAFFCLSAAAAAFFSLRGHVGGAVPITWRRCASDICHQ